jgi:HEAT repeat protein
MAMRSCEWALKANENMGSAISLWLAAFFKAEGTGVAQPASFGAGHADAMTYATTAGAEYLHEGLERALGDKDAYVSLGLVEALAVNAGEKSLLYRIGTEQPLVKALSFEDRMVRYSAAIAIGQAGPNSNFVGSKLIIENLAAAIGDEGNEELGQELADVYALRAINVMLKLVLTRNMVVDAADATKALIEATSDSRNQMQVLAGQVLARLGSPDAQRAIADMALLKDNSQEIRVEAFKSLAISAKTNAQLLTNEQIDAIYELIGSDSTDPVLRGAAAGAYGALNLPSRKVKDLILDQSAS